MTETHDKLRAVFLSALMVVSVFGGTVAFAGTAAANASNLAVTSGAPAQPDGTITVSTSIGNSGGKVTFLVEDSGSTESNTKTVTDGGADDLQGSADGSVITQLDLGSLYSSAPADGEATVYASEGESVSAGNADDTVTFTIDGTAPTLESASKASDTEIEVVIGDNNDVDENTIETADFTVSEGSIDSVSASDSGSDATVTVTLTESVDASTVDVGLASEATISDTAGNALTASDAGTVTVGDMDGVAPSVENLAITDVTNGDGKVQSGDTVEVSADVSDGGSGVNTVTTDASDFGAGSVELTDDDSDGTYTATFEVGSGGASEGTYSLTVTAADNQGNTDTGTTGDLEVNTIPSVVNVDITNAPILDGETGDEQTVTVEFSEAMDTTASPTVEIVGVTDGPLEVSESQWTNSDKTWEGTVTIPDNDEEVTANISVAGAKDEEGNTINPDPYDTHTFEIDSSSPTVENVDVANAPINDADADDEQLVTVTFSEAMDDSTVPTVVVQEADGTEITTVSKKDGVSNNGFGVNDGFDSDANTWTGVVDLSSSGYDGTATVVVKDDGDAKDPSGNLIEASDNTGTFEMDTEAPVVSPSIPGSAQSDTIDLTGLFTVDTGDSDSLTTTYAVNGETVSSPSNFDTTDLADGEVSVSLTAVDDAGNLDSASGTIVIDNNDPSVSTKLNDGQPIAGSVSVTEAFDIQKGGTETVKFEYDAGSGWTTVGDVDSDLDDSLDLSTHEGDTIQLRVTVTDADGTTEATAEVNDLYVDNLDKPDVSVNQNDGGTFTVVVTPEAGAQLTDINVALEAQNELASYEDGYSASTRTLTTGDFTETTTNIGDYQYVATVTARPDDAKNLHDGEYDVKLQSVTDNNNRAYEGDDSPDAAGVIDFHSEVLVDHAFITDASDGETKVELQFNEPVDVTSLSASDLAFRGETLDTIGGSSVQSGNTDGDDGVITVTIGKNIQTGDAPSLAVANNEAITELADGDNDGSAEGVNEGTNGHSVASIKLTLEDGLNTVSVPAASGGISADALFQENSYVQSVWTYDAETESWSNYNPSADDEAPILEGGEAFIVMVQTPEDVSHDDISLYVNTKVSSGNLNPTEQHLEKGWNLVGHYQEGQQEADDALESLNGNYDDVYQLGSDGNYELVNTDDDGDSFQPGEGYWVFVTEDGEIYKENADWTDLTS